MQASPGCDLGLAVAEFETRPDDGAVTLFPSLTVRQDVLQAGTVVEAMCAGDFLEEVYGNRAPRFALSRIKCPSVFELIILFFNILQT